MSNVWQFSSYSEPLLQKFLQTVVSRDGDNEWSKKFGLVNEHHPKRHKVEKINKEPSIEIKSDEEPSPSGIGACETVEDKHPDTNDIDELFCDTIETEPTSKLDYMMEECMKRPNLITKLAEHLSVSAVEKVFNVILTKQDINVEFITLFLQTFFPVFLKREHTWLTLDLLVKACKKYPEPFEPVLIKIIRDVNIKCSILQELTQTMASEFQKHLIFLIMHINISSDVFVHHLHTLYLAYKDCAKTENLQNFIQTKLLESASHCANDKNYGRLFLTFLQAQKLTGYPTNLTMLDSCISQHNSPFKRPCLNVIKDMMGNDQT